MKRIRFFTAFVLLLALAVSGCGSMSEEKDKLSVVCTTFPAYDWVNSIIGDNAEMFEVTLLSGNGDLHSYQPTARDITEIKSCDLFIYTGGVSDGWTDSVIKESDIKTLKLFDALEGELLCSGHEHNHGAEHSAEEYDEHIWLSPKTAQTAFEAIYEEILDLAPECESFFSQNREECRKKFEKLNRDYLAAVSESDDKTVIFADRFPFIYMTEEYGIEAVAAFPGCSADTNASFEVIARLAKAVDEYDKKTVLVLENSNQSVAETVIKSTQNKDAEVAVMNSCQSMSTSDIEQGADYFDIMEENLDALKKALE